MAREHPKQLQVIPPPSVEENHESILISDDPEGCRTPTSHHDHEIPLFLSCPPAPKRQGKLENHDGSMSDDAEGCRTPTSHHHKIPLILSCPPAPKKQGKLKRKFQEQPVFEFTVGDEVDALFIASIELCRVSSRRRYN